MPTKIEVRYREDIPDALGRGIMDDVQDLGISNVSDVRTAQVYHLIGDVGPSMVEQLCTELLADAVTQIYAFAAEEPDDTISSEAIDTVSDAWSVEVRFKPGVTDTVGDSVMKGCRDIGLTGINEIHTGHRYDIRGEQLARPDVESVSRRLLANELIQTIHIRQL